MAVIQSFLAGDSVNLTFDVSGVGFTPATATYRVIDEEGLEIVPATAVTVVVGTPVAVLIPASLNVLPGPIHAAWNAFISPTGVARTVYLTVSDATGKYLASLEQSYAVVMQNRLIAPQNTFQTLASAKTLAMDVPNLPGWNAAADLDQIAALIEARNRVGRLTFRYQPDDWQMRVSPWLSVHDFDEMTPAQWVATDYLFKMALRRAQLLEADSVLSDAGFFANGMQGVTSIKIGDSERHFSRMRRGRFVLCDRAMAVLSKFVSHKQMGRG